MVLNESIIRNAMPGTKPYKLGDGGGLFLLINPAGGKWWRFRYRFQGKEKLLSFGTYPKVSIFEARGLRDNHRQILKRGIDPSVLRKAGKARHKAEHRKKQPESVPLASSVPMVPIRFMMDGSFELWKDGTVIHLSSTEALFVTNKLSALMRCPNGVD